jgi:class 3 adenylate cyclase
LKRIRPLLVVSIAIAVGGALPCSSQSASPVQSLNYAYFIDSTASISATEAAQRDAEGRFAPMKRQTVSLGFTVSALWIRFSAYGLVGNDAVVLVKHSLLHEVSLYRDGRLIGTDSRLAPPVPGAVFGRYSEIPLPRADGAYYLRIAGEDSILAPVDVVSRRDAERLRGLENLIYGLWFGAIATMVIYLAISFRGYRDWNWFVLAVYLVMFALWETTFTGLDRELLPSLEASIRKNICGITVGPYALLKIVFIYRFFEPIKRNLFLRLYSLVCLLLWSFLSIFGFLLPAIGIPMLDFRFSAPVVTYASVTALAFIFFAPLMYRKGEKSALHVMFGMAGFFVLNVLSMSRHAGVLPDVWYTRYALLAASIFEAVFFILALNRKLADIRIEREQALSALVEEKGRALETQTRMANSFHRFVPREFLTMLNRGDIVDVALGDQAGKVMTILFADIRAFTTLSETMSPRENFNFINAFLEAIVPAVRAQGGFVDKYIGDAIMALFEDPPARAAAAAADMRTALRLFNEQLVNRGLRPIDIGIGLHRGDLMLGTVGDAERLQTTVIADAVNIASRLESMTKDLGAPVLASTSFGDALGPGFPLRPLGRVSLKGKHEEVGIVELLNDDGDSLVADKRATRSGLEEAFRSLDAGHTAEARAALRAMVEVWPKDKTLSCLARSS